MVEGSPFTDPKAPVELQHSPELMGVPEQFRNTNVYTVEGEDLIPDIKAARIKEQGDISELQEALVPALAYVEGLSFSPYGESYDLNRPDSPDVVYLMNQFTAGETMTRRNQHQYVSSAINQTLTAPVREAVAWKRNPQAWTNKEGNKLQDEMLYRNRMLSMRGEPTLSNEQITSVVLERLQGPRQEIRNKADAIDNLKKIEMHVEARQMVDAAFQQRMLVCAVEELTAEIQKRLRVVSPDKGHWKGFFQYGEPGFGDNVDKVLRMIDDDGPSGIYAKGFKDSDEFVKWLKPKLEAANGRMDHVWAAWRLALLWEIPSKYSAVIDQDKDKWSTGNPPVINGLMSWTINTQAHRYDEWGMKADGKTRFRGDKSAAKAGYGWSIPKLKQLAKGGFLDETSVGDKNNLYEVWKGNPSKGLRPMSFANPDFPWVQADAHAVLVDADETSSGAFDSWLINRGRDNQILSWIRETKGAKTLTSPDFFEGIARTLRKRQHIRNNGENLTWVDWVLFDKISAHYIGTAYPDYPDAKGETLNPWDYYSTTNFDGFTYKASSKLDEATSSDIQDTDIIKFLGDAILKGITNKEKAKKIYENFSDLMKARAKKEPVHFRHS